MKTLLIDPADKRAMEDAAAALRRGGVIGFPTETVYGLGADATSPDAVKKIFEAKGRPSDNPLIVHIYDKAQIEEIASEVTPLGRALIDAFMPGPITVILRRNKDLIPDEVTAGLDTVGIRMPEDEICREFLSLCGVPVAAPSANLSGSPSPTRSEHVVRDMDGRVYGIILGNDCRVGLESTVVDATGEVPVILRPGAVTAEMISEAVNRNVQTAGAPAEGETPRSPGMKYRHYAPKASVTPMPVPENVLRSEPVYMPEDGDYKDPYKGLSPDQRKVLFDAALPYMEEIKKILDANPFARIGLFCGREVMDVIGNIRDESLTSHINYYVYGDCRDTETAAHCLFDGLRHLDRQKVDSILAASFPEEGLGTAYMNRLSKACGNGSDIVPDAPEETSNAIPDELTREVHTASVMFLTEDDLCLGPACDAIFSDIIRREGPYCLEDDREIGVELYCESAGTDNGDGSPADPKMTEILGRTTGLRLGYHKASIVTIDRINDNDLIFTPTESMMKDIVDLYPGINGKLYSLSSYLAGKGLVFKDDRGGVVSLSIPDPRGENDATYEHTVKALSAWLNIMFPYVLKDLGIERR